MYLPACQDLVYMIRFIIFMNDADIWRRNISFIDLRTLLVLNTNTAWVVTVKYVHNVGVPVDLDCSLTAGQGRA